MSEGSDRWNIDLRLKGIAVSIQWRKALQPLNRYAAMGGVYKLIFRDLALVGIAYI